MRGMDPWRSDGKVGAFRMKHLWMVKYKVQGIHCTSTLRAHGDVADLKVLQQGQHGI